MQREDGRKRLLNGEPQIIAVEVDLRRVAGVDRKEMEIDLKIAFQIGADGSHARHCPGARRFGCGLRLQSEQVSQGVDEEAIQCAGPMWLAAPLQQCDRLLFNRATKLQQEPALAYSGVANHRYYLPLTGQRTLEG
jgi:hypothetical protein